MKRKMRLAKILFQLAKNIFQRSTLGKCKPQNIFCKLHFFCCKKVEESLMYYSMPLVEGSS